MGARGENTRLVEAGRGQGWKAGFEMGVTVRPLGVELESAVRPLVVEPVVRPLRMPDGR
jgi:hypothetical protein